MVNPAELILKHWYEQSDSFGVLLICYLATASATCILLCGTTSVDSSQGTVRKKETLTSDIALIESAVLFPGTKGM